jgi:asparagine synthase (glutamine-hydrolysing)
MRLISDVPLGALLSGGVDSSTVVAMMARVSDTPVKTFTIGFSNSDFDEASHARAVAQQFGTEHHELVVDPNLWETLERLSTIMDEPFADSSVIPTYHVCRLAKQYVTVVLSGDGGDEFFAGYDRYVVHNQRRHLDRLPCFARNIYRRHIYPKLPYRVRTRKLAYNVALNARDRYVHGMSFLSMHDRDLSLVSPEFIETIHDAHPEEILQQHFDLAPASDLISRMQYADAKTYLTADVLTKVDRMSMAASLEVRSPLLDHVFCEFAAALPLSMKLCHGARKYLLCKLAERLQVPPSVLYRPKQGFSLPLVHWMRSELKSEITSLLLEPGTLQRGYFAQRAIERTLREHHRGQRDHSAIIWQLLAFELWNRNYLGRTFHSPVQTAPAGVQL